MTTYANNRRQWSQDVMEYLTQDQTSSNLSSWALQAQIRDRPPAWVWSVQISSSKFNKCNSQWCSSNNSNKWWLRCSNSASSSNNSSLSPSRIILVRQCWHPLCNRLCSSSSINRSNTCNLISNKYQCNNSISNLCQCQCHHQAFLVMEACKLTENEHIRFLHNPHQ